MPVGVPDFWPGQLIHYENVPTDGRLDASPTSNWAYDHEHNESAHHVKTWATDILIYSRPIYSPMYNRDVADKELADWIMDGNWHDWLLPFGGQVDMEAVMIRFWGRSTGELATLNLKGAGPVGAMNEASFSTYTVDTVFYQECIVGLDGTGIVRYKTVPEAWDFLSALMAGFWR